MVPRVSMAYGSWNQKHTAAFENCKRTILHRAILAHRDKDKLLCIYIDASDSNCSGTVMQVPRIEQSLYHAKKDYEKLEFHSGRFFKKQHGCSTL